MMNICILADNPRHIFVMVYFMKKRKNKKIFLIIDRISKN